MMHAQRQATTLIELMIVTVVIGILALVLVPRVEESRNQALLAEVRAQLDSMTWMARRYHARQESYEGFDGLYEAEGSVSMTFTWLREDGMLVSAQHLAVPDHVCHTLVGEVPDVLVPEGALLGRSVCVEL